MKKMLAVAAFYLMTNAVLAQDYSEDLADCNYEKDEVYIDWDDDTNLKYAERKLVERLSKKRLRAFYCQNLVARDRLATDGHVQSKGSFQLLDDDEKILIFNIKMGDLTYQDKLYIHIGPEQKLFSSKD